MNPPTRQLTAALAGAVATPVALPGFPTAGDPLLALERQRVGVRWLVTKAASDATSVLCSLLEREAHQMRSPLPKQFIS